MTIQCQARAFQGQAWEMGTHTGSGLRNLKVIYRDDPDADERIGIVLPYTVVIS